jgi:hypothetical protein
MGFTNPGAFTLNMDGIGAKTAKTPSAAATTLNWHTYSS